MTSIIQRIFHHHAADADPYDARGRSGRCQSSLLGACSLRFASVPVSVPGPVSGDTSLALARLQARQVNPYGGSGDPEWKAKRDHDSLIIFIVVLLFLAAIAAYSLVSWRLGLKGVDCLWWCLRQLNPMNHWEAWCAFWKDRTRQRRRRREGIELQPYPGPPPDAPYQRLPSPARPAPALIRLGRFRFLERRGV